MDIADVLIIAGLLSFLAGVLMVYVPAGLMALGILLLIAAYIKQRKGMNGQT